MIRRLLARATGKKAPLHFYNTLGKEKQLFTKPLHAKQLRLYSCGPTVYDRQHVGNLSAAVFGDTIRRVLEKNNFEVKQVINITDFGHLSGDNEGDPDIGEDKMTKGMKKEGLVFSMENMRAFGTKFMNIYLEDIKALNVATDKISFPRASDYVPAMIAILSTLEEKGYAYKTSDGMYFDTARFPNYGALGGIDLEHLKEGARVRANIEKKSPSDFALWKFNKNLGWDSPWGKGFPGWHLECSAMINSVLGKQIDIHTGGIEHIAVHHNNEIAQSEAATGKRPFSRFWMHRAHIQMDGAKISKSDGNTAYLSDVIERGIHPLALRYWFLTGHYRQSTNFTWEAVEAAQTALLRLFHKMQSVASAEEAPVPSKFAWLFMERINDDLDTPGALAVVWEHLKDSYSPTEIKALLLDADQVFGFDLARPDQMMQSLMQQTFGTNESVAGLPENIRALIEKREQARKDKDWSLADQLRDQLKADGYEIEDKADGMRVIKK